MSNFLIDSHCHLHEPEYFPPKQAEKALASAAENHVKQVICIGTSPENSLLAAEFAKNHENVFWTYGIHPEFVNFHSVENLDFDFAGLKPVAIGEIGLDYHYEGYNRAAEIQLFEQQLQLARDLSLPVSLHIREAFDDAWAILANFPELSGVVHSFTGSKKDLRIALERGFFIGVNGLATYTTNPLPPLENMLLETDAPFLTPVPFRGTMNEPKYIRVIADYLAEKTGVENKIIWEQTTKNVKQLFRI